MKTPIYLDYNATTPTDPRVVEKMLPFFTERFGNAASRHHQWGCDAAEAVERAREEVAQLIGADPREIIFTSGATEAVNLAIKGVAASPAYRQRRRHIVTVATEHKAVLDTCRYLQDNGCEITFLPVDSHGVLNRVPNRLFRSTPQHIDGCRMKDGLERQSACSGDDDSSQWDRTFAAHLPKRSVSASLLNGRRNAMR